MARKTGKKRVMELAAQSFLLRAGRLREPGVRDECLRAGYIRLKAHLGATGRLQLLRKGRADEEYHILACGLVGYACRAAVVALANQADAASGACEVLMSEGEHRLDQYARLVSHLAEDD